MSPKWMRKRDELTSSSFTEILLSVSKFTKDYQVAFHTSRVRHVLDCLSILNCQRQKWTPAVSSLRSFPTCSSQWKCKNQQRISHQEGLAGLGYTLSSIFTSKSCRNAHTKVGKTCQNVPALALALTEVILILKFFFLMTQRSKSKILSQVPSFSVFSQI